MEEGGESQKGHAAAVAGQDVLGEAGAHGRPVVVHAAAYQPGAVGHAQPQPLGLDTPGQDHILHHLLAHRFMAAHGGVGGAAKGQALAIGRGKGGPGGVMHRQDGQVAQDGQGHEGHHQPFSPGHGLLRGPDGEQIGLAAGHEVGDGRHGGWRGLHVGIQEEQDVALGGLGQLVAGPVFAQPPGRE